MALYIPKQSEAFVKLRAEGIDVRPYEAASGNALALNYTNQMPEKALVATDVQWCRLIGNSKHDVRVNFLYVDKPENIPNGRRKYCQHWSATSDQIADASILTGTGNEHLKLTTQDIPTLDILRDSIEWDRENSRSSLYICWAAQLALLWDHGIGSTKMDTKFSGVYPQQLHLPTLPSFAALSNLSKSAGIETPVSRYRSINPNDLCATQGRVVPIFSSALSGLGLAYAPKGNRFYSLNHGEYDRVSLAKEYDRDVLDGKNPNKPYNYDLGRANDPGPPPWRAVGQIIVNRLLDAAAEARQSVSDNKQGRMRSLQAPAQAVPA